MCAYVSPSCYFVIYFSKDISHSANPDEVDEDAVVSDEPGTTVNDDDKTLPDIPIILPRRRYAGARNVATVKDGMHHLLRNTI